MTQRNPPIAPVLTFGGPLVEEGYRLYWEMNRRLLDAACLLPHHQTGAIGQQKRHKERESQDEKHPFHTCDT